MLTEPENYLASDHFFFQANDDLEKVCNAPNDQNGVFKVLELRDGKINLVFLGFSKFGGLFSEIVNGMHFDKNSRKLGWSYQLIKDKTDAIDIYWYVTRPEDDPQSVNVDLLKRHLDKYGKLPKWNK